MLNKSILHIAPTPFFSDRGCHIRIEGIVRSLTSLGHDNIVCTYHHGHDVGSVKTTRISTIKNYTKTEAGPSKYKLWADFKLLLLVLKQIRLQKPDVIHAHLHEGLFIGIAAKIIFFWHRIPLIADIQGSLTGELETHGAFKKLFFLKLPTSLLERMLMWFPTHTVCSSQHSVDKLIKEFGMKQQVVSLAQDGADAVKFSDADKDKITKLKSKLNLPANKSIVFYSGALLESKGLAELQELIKGLKSHADKLHFLIIGYPTTDIESYLKENQLDGLCTLTGRVPFKELALYMDIADIAIDPKNSNAGEGSGKMLNYLASGLPIVAFDTQNNRDFLGDNITLAKDVEQMQDLVIAYCAHHETRTNIAKQNLNRFKKHFSWDATQQQLESVYSAL